MYNKFIRALTWNSINVFLYKSILLIHQIILFYVIPKELYGASGTLFASIYLLIGFTSFGFEYTLFPFFKQLSQTKQYFKQVIKLYRIRIFTILTATVCIWYLLSSWTTNHVISFFMYHIPDSLLIYLLLIFISESIKKSLETAAQLAFLNKQITTIQISMIITYVLLVWSSYLTTGTITIHSIFIPMVVTSYAENLFLIAILYQYYQELPTGSETEIISYPVVYKQQIFNYLNQVAKNIFSPNFLMVFLAYNLGMAQTGYIRFFTNIITLLYMLLNRSIGVPSGALFASMTKETMERTRQAFLKITNAYIQLLYALAIIIGVTITPHLLKSNEQSLIPHIILFITAGFIEYIALTYEKLYIVQQAAHILAFINTSSILLLIFLLDQQWLYFGLSWLLLPICLIRLCTILSIGYIAYKKWAIQPKIALNRYTIIISSLVTLLLSLAKSFYC